MCAHSLGASFCNDDRDVHSDFNIMNKTVELAKKNGVKVGAHPSLPDLQGFGRREMAIEPVRLFLLKIVFWSNSHVTWPEQAELMNCFMYQVGALSGFLKLHGLSMNHVSPRCYICKLRKTDTSQVKPHGAIYGQTARSLPLSRAVIDVIKVFQKGQKEDIAFMGMPGTAHQTAAEEAGVKFIAGMFALSSRDPPKLTTRAEWFADLDYSPEGKLIITQ